MATPLDGIGTLIGAGIADSDLSKGMDSVNGISTGFQGATQPYTDFGKSFLSKAGGAIDNLNSVAGSGLSYDDFMKNYQTSPGAKYQMGQADEAQNNSAAATGKLLSGGNERALSTINQGIASTYANQAFGNYLAGNQQHFGQLNSALGDMFSAIGVGTTTNSQVAGVDTANMNAQSSLAAAKAKNDQGKGSGLGSIFSGLGSFATMF